MASLHPLIAAAIGSVAVFAVWLTATQMRPQAALVPVRRMTPRRPGPLRR